MLFSYVSKCKQRASAFAKGFPGGWVARGKESAYQCRRHNRCGFDAWVEKIPWRKKWQLLQYSCLENPMNSRAWQAMGSPTVGQDQASTHTKCFHFSKNGII